MVEMISGSRSSVPSGRFGITEGEGDGFTDGVGSTTGDRAILGLADSWRTFCGSHPESTHVSSTKTLDRRAIFRAGLV